MPPVSAVLALGIFLVAFYFIAHREGRQGQGRARRLVADGGPATVFFSEHAGIDWNVIFMLFGMMIIVGIVKQAGIFDYLAIWSAKARGKPYRLMVMLMGITRSRSFTGLRLDSSSVGNVVRLWRWFGEIYPRSRGRAVLRMTISIMVETPGDQGISVNRHRRNSSSRSHPATNAAAALPHDQYIRYTVNVENRSVRVS